MGNFMYGLTHPIKVFTDTMAYGTTPLKIFAVAMYVISIVGGFIGGYYLANLFI